MTRRLTAPIAAAILAVLAASAAAILNSDLAKAAPSDQTRTWIKPVRPYQPGDLVWTTSPPVTEIGTESSLSSGCQRVPASGYISTGVYASSSSQLLELLVVGSGFVRSALQLVRQAERRIERRQRLVERRRWELQPRLECLPLEGAEPGRHPAGVERLLGRALA